VSAREEILGRIRAAVGDVPRRDVPRLYRTSGGGHADAREKLFVERVRDYGAVVLETTSPRDAIGAALAEHGARRVAIAADLPESLRPAGVELVVDDGLTAIELDGVDGALTTCAAACAETGTIALDGGSGQGRRMLTLVPDLHVCVVRREDVVETVPELLARLEQSARAGQPIVLVSGPSATSDIELTRVEGVHGPRRLVVVLTA
jgi:L-lactate dehydrogenase complex protein LldG